MGGRALEGANEVPFIKKYTMRVIELPVRFLTCHPYEQEDDDDDEEVDEGGVNVDKKKE